jgi:ADP-heptose:LPS heptosyltransferase
MTTLEPREGKKRGLIVMKESIGDILIVSALFKGFHEHYPNTDLYVAVDPKYKEILDGNEHVYKVLPYNSIMENELSLIGQGTGPRYFDHFFHPGITTQRQLSYLSNKEPAFDINLSAK